MNAEQKERWALSVVLTAIVVICIWVFTAHHDRVNHLHYDRDKCRSNLRNIAAGCVEYANNHNDHYPDRIEELVELGVTPEILVCPRTETMWATGTRDEMIEAIASGKNLSYVYVGKGLTAAAPPEYVLAYEPLTNHHNEGMNVLFADYHVRWLDPKEAKDFLDHIVAGKTVIWRNK